MFKIITPIVLAVLAVTASKEGSNDITRRLLGEDYNNIGQEGSVDAAGGDNGLGSKSALHSPHIDVPRVLGVKNDEKVDGPLMTKAQDVDDDNRNNGSMMMAQNGDDNGLESKHGGYVRGNDYYKRDYFDKPYYPRYRATEGGDFDGAAFSMMANEGGNPDDAAAPFVLMDGEAEDNNRIAVASRYGGYRRNNNYGYNGYRRNYYKNNGYGPYWANEGGDPEMDSLSFTKPGHDGLVLANQGGKPIDDDAAQGLFMANEGGNLDDGAARWAFMDGEVGDDNRIAVESRYGGYGRRNNYGYNGYNGYRRNYYKNNGYGPYWANEGGDNEMDSICFPPYCRTASANEGGKPMDDDAAQGVFMANEGGNPEDGARPWSILGQEAGDGDDNGLPLASRYGRYGRNDYYRNNRYYRYYRNGRNDYYNGYDRQYRNGYNNDDRYRANEGGNNQEPDAFGMMANEGGNPGDDAASPWEMMDGDAGDNNDRMALGSRYGGYRRNDYGYKGYGRSVGNNHYRNRYNDGYGYRANEGGMNEGAEPKSFGRW